MGPFFAVIGVLAVVLGALALHHRRGNRHIAEAVRCSTVGELEAGRFRIFGTVVAARPVQSPLDGTDCVFFEHADYRPTLGASVMVREQSRWSEGCAFYVDDGTGRARIDPAIANIEAPVLTEDGGLTVERRLQVGEEVEVVATFKLAEPDPFSPYRDVSREWHGIGDEIGPPRISYRTMPGMLRPTDEFGTFVGAASVFLVGVGALLAVLVSLAG